MKLVWFRNDLRVRDNPALYQACEDERRGQKPCGVIAVAIICPQQWLSHDDSPNKVAFWLENLEQLKIELNALNIPALHPHYLSCRNVIIVMVCILMRSIALMSSSVMMRLNLY